MRTTIDEGIDEGSTTSGAERPTRLPAWAGTVAVVAVVVVGIALRFVQRSPLWLDEALSVNIAQLPVGDLFEALRHDGHPPFYYLLLHYWMEVVGDGDVAVRALSGVFAVGSLPLVWVAGRRLAGTNGARWAVVVAALSPYWVRYATETRMYSLVMLLVLAGYLLLVDALERPTWPRLAGIAAVSGLLLLTHYWAIYLLVTVGALLLLRAWHRPGDRATTVPAIVAVAAGGLLFLPWLGGFLYQAANTGTPWAGPMRPGAIVEAVLTDLGGGTTLAEAMLYGLVTAALIALALLTARSGGHEIVLDLRTVPAVRREAVVVAGALAVGCVASYATSATFQSRYAAVVAPLILLVVALGITRLPSGVPRLAVGGVYLGLALVGVFWVNYYQRTQSAEVAAEVAARAQPGDVVVYCPDQLGPAFSREMPPDLDELAYPTLDDPARVDWVDYAARNAAADPAAIAADILERADGNAVFLVWMSGYETFGEQCENLVGHLGLTETLVPQDESRFYEPASLAWTPRASAEPPSDPASAPG